MRLKRLFVAIPIAEDLRSVLASCSDNIGHPGLQWTPPENLHITLLFIGNTPEENIPGIKRKLSALTEMPAFQLQCEAITAVKRRGKTAMIWAQFKENTSFFKLATQVSAVLAVPPDHPPLPHITMARVKPGKHVVADHTAFPAIDHLQVNVQTIGLWESQLQPAGAMYSVVAEWHLRTEL